MTDTDHQACLNLALEKAFATRNAEVRIAYFELANFYHRKIGAAGKTDQSADLLNGLAQECCSEKHCWCKSSHATQNVGSAA